MLNKIKTKEEIDKDKRKNQIIIGVILIGLMVLSTAGYSLMSGDKTNEDKSTYKGFKFVKQSGYWITEINKQAFYFQYLPQDLENVSVYGTYNIADYSGKPLYLVNSNPAAAEILRNLQGISRYQEACISGMNCTSSEFPIKTCSDNVIIFNFEGNKTEVKKEGSCVYISGEMEKSADAFIYKILGVK